ncbi:adenosine receptor A2b-like [Montipora capricornis]|uniref:adenosine receptor A2b-like n=1 Tax=Montipora foliosa TaxID=591990 RepID=UPI0035F1EA21
MPFIKHLCEETWPPFALSVLTASIAFGLCLITLPGNFLLCIAMIKDPYKELKNSFNCFVLQLAISDLVVGALTEPLFIMFHTREAMGYPVMHNVWLIHLSFFVSYTASLLSLVALTLDRYFTVMSYHKRVLSNNTVNLISVLIWVISISLSCFYFVTGFYLFAFMFNNAALIIIVTILTFTYVRIHQRLKQQITRWSWLHQTQVKLKAMSMERKLNRAFYTILGIFLACLIPSAVMMYIISFSDNCSCTLVHWFRDLDCLFPLVNCSVNQFLYAWKSRNFRRAVTTVFCKTASYEVTSPPLTPNGTVSTINSKRADELEPESMIALDPVRLLRATAMDEDVLCEVHDNIVAEE